MSVKSLCLKIKEIYIIKRKFLRKEHSFQRSRRLHVIDIIHIQSYVKKLRMQIYIHLRDMEAKNLRNLFGKNLEGLKTSENKT